MSYNYQNQRGSSSVNKVPQDQHKRGGTHNFQRQQKEIKSITRLPYNEGSQSIYKSLYEGYKTNRDQTSLGVPGYNQNQYQKERKKHKIGELSNEEKRVSRQTEAFKSSMYNKNDDQLQQKQRILKENTSGGQQDVQVLKKICLQSEKSQQKTKEQMNFRIEQIQLKFHQQQLLRLDEKLETISKNVSTKRTLKQEREQKKQIQQEKKQLRDEFLKIKKENEKLILEKKNLQQKLKQKQVPLNKQSSEPIQSIEKQIEKIREIYRNKMNSESQKLQQAITGLEILKNEEQEKYQKKYAEEKLKVERLQKNEQNERVQYQKLQQQMSIMKNNNEKSVKELQKKQAQYLSEIDRFVDFHKLNSSASESFEQFLTLMSGIVSNSKEVKKKFSNQQARYIEAFEKIAWQSGIKIDIHDKNHLRDDIVKKIKEKQREIRKSSSEQKQKIQELQKSQTEYLQQNQFKINELNERMNKMINEYQGLKRQNQILSEEKSELKKKIESEKKQDSFKNKRQDHSQKLKEIEITQLKERLEIFQNLQKAICSQANKKLSQQHPHLKSLKQLHLYLREMKVDIKRQQQPINFRSSEILQSYPDSIKFLTEVVKKVHPDSRIANTKLIFKSDVENKTLTHVLEKCDSSIMILCRTKEQTFGAYIEQISSSPYQYKKTVLFSLSHEITYPANFRKDKKIRSCQIDRRGLVLFGENQLKITSNMELIYVGSQQGYFGLLDTKKMFGSNYDYSMTIEECEIHFIHFD